ncbi:MAG: hypothetical protein PVI13_02335 [Desulfobacterales bacterium]
MIGGINKVGGQNGKFQILRICHIRIFCNIDTCLNLPVSPILANLNPGEKKDGNFYFVGYLNTIFAILVFWQQGYEVNFHSCHLKKLAAAVSMTSVVSIRLKG